MTLADFAWAHAEQTRIFRRFQAIYHIIRRRITLLEYAPGKILDIDALAKEFKVSRTPIRSPGYPTGADAAPMRNSDHAALEDARFFRWGNSFYNL